MENYQIDCVVNDRYVHTKHDSKSLEMFNHYRDMRADGIACHCNICEYSIRLIRAFENGDPYLSPKNILMPRSYKRGK